MTRPASLLLERTSRVSRAGLKPRGGRRLVRAQPWSIALRVAPRRSFRLRDFSGWQNDCATRGPLMDWLNWWIVGAVSLVTLYGAARLVLRHYFPPAKRPRHDSEKPAGESGRGRLLCAGRSPAHRRPRCLPLGAVLPRLETFTDGMSAGPKPRGFDDRVLTGHYWPTTCDGCFNCSAANL
jgi:hypothetical protein